MKVQTPAKPGWFFRNGHQYLAASKVPQTLNLSSHQINDAFVQREMCIELVFGCKVVELAQMVSHIDMMEGKK